MVPQNPRTAPHPAGPGRRRRAVAAALAVLAFGAVACGNDADRTAQTRETERGFTEDVTVPNPGTGPQLATARPEKLPPLMKAPQKCKPSLDEVRDFLDENPYGMTATLEQFAELDQLLQKARSNAACPPEVLVKFTHQEVDPWYLWVNPKQTPGPAKDGPEGTTRAPEGRKHATNPEPETGSAGTDAEKK